MRILLLTTLLIVCASIKTRAQEVSLELVRAPLQDAFHKIKLQTGYEFVYTREQLGRAQLVTLQIKNASLSTTLQEVFKSQPFQYTIEGKHIVLKDRPSPVMARKTIARELRGIVTDENGTPLNGATVAVKRSGIATASDAGGNFLLREIEDDDRLLISAVGFHSKEIPVAGRTNLAVQLTISVGTLDEAVLIAYGTTTRRFNTGNVTKVGAEEIARQPVSNPLAALTGRVPGMVVTQSSGVPGAGFSVEIRGRTSLDPSLSRNNPLFLIDGIPFEPGNVAADQLTSAARNPTSTSQGGLSPLSILSPDDIESIEVLKDADATAIYGSRGANGVVLITTKKGKTGKTAVSLDYQQGWSKVTRTMDLLNTMQYAQMRREAFRNDATTPTAANAPDLLLWDTTRYTDLKRLLIGGTAVYQNAAATLSGGTSNTKFLLKAGYTRETTVFSRDLSFTRGSFIANIHHSTTDRRFTTFFQTSFSTANNNLIATDLTRYINLPPHILLYDSSGNLAWREKGVNFSSVNSSVNPLAELRKTYAAENDNLALNLSLNYKLFKDFVFKTTLGLNRNGLAEHSSVPKAAIAPNLGTLASAKFANASTRNWIIEPQLEYSTYVGRSKLTFLLGSTWQENVGEGTTVNGTNYTNDLLLHSVAAAGSVSSTNYYTQYRYTALFGRIGYRLMDRYLLNLSARRDGSTRFGPEKRFANFAALGGGWIFSSEPRLQKALSFLSYGKIRASYGITGNDQIGDYRYLDLWNNAAFPYQGIPGVSPASIYNPEYEWEINKKLEAAIELGFLKDRLFFSASFYRNRSSNQLVSYRLPGQAGFTSVTKNLPALVQNTGVEMIVEYKTLASKTFSWSTAFTITLPKNKLVSFPGLASSSYYATYVEGRSLSTIQGYQFLGVDPVTGVYTFEDVNKDGQLRSADDYRVIGHLDPQFYGGLQHTIQYRNLQLACFVQFTKQTGSNYLKELSVNPPGSISNQPVLVLDRWQKPGDVAPIQRFATLNGSPASVVSRTVLQNSSAIYSDASFVRLRNVSISYHFPSFQVGKRPFGGARVFMNAENLLTITGYQGADPETQNYYRLPPIRTIVLGIHLGF